MYIRIFVYEVVYEMQKEREEEEEEEGKKQKQRKSLFKYYFVDLRVIRLLSRLFF